MSGTILSLIERKRDGEELTAHEISLLVDAVARQTIPEYQVGALLMAIYLRGMTSRETAELTMAMVRSGEVVDLSALQGFKVDKHSTGGVGDKVSLVLGPLVAAAGVLFPKLSGRGLGHTGGTLDKLESIPGFRVDLSVDELIQQVREIGIAITGQTGELVPADKVLYGLRDLTATVDSVPLIASSVMSKKIAAGADAIVLDVKCGVGAFMLTLEDARALARMMVAIGKSAGKETAAFITSMEEPLGRAVGNALEVTEAIGTLRGDPGDLREVCLALGSQILVMAKRARSVEEAGTMLEETMSSGAALERFRQMVEWQGGDPRVVADPHLLPRAYRVIPLTSPVGGYVQHIDARRVGLFAMELGAGRKTKDDAIDYAVGVEIAKKVSDRVEEGEVLALVHSNSRDSDENMSDLLKAFSLGEKRVQKTPHVLDVVTDA